MSEARAPYTPETLAPSDLARQWGVSERRLRKIARDIGACSIFGKTMLLTPDDAKAILEAMRPCPSSSRNETASGTTAARLPENGYDDLLKLRTKKQPSKSQRKPSRQRGNVTYMAPPR